MTSAVKWGRGCYEFEKKLEPHKQCGFIFILENTFIIFFKNYKKTYTTFGTTNELNFTKIIFERFLHGKQSTTLGVWFFPYLVFCVFHFQVFLFCHFWLTIDFWDIMHSVEELFFFWKYSKTYIFIGGLLGVHYADPTQTTLPVWFSSAFTAVMVCKTSLWLRSTRVFGYLKCVE